MKKIFKNISIVGLSGFLLCIAGFWIYGVKIGNGYARWASRQHTSKYAPNTCVVDTQVHRIHKITGFHPLKNVCVSTVILRAGDAINGSHAVGTEDCIMEDDSRLKPIACP